MVCVYRSVNGVFFIYYFAFKAKKKYIWVLNIKTFKKMAKIKTTAIVADIRGKLNGSVFSKNRGGSFVRTKVTPSNPQTSFQAAVRSVLGGLAQGWRSLTQAQRSAWNAAVSNYTGTDIFGDIKTPSGINLYTKLNANLAEAGQAYISTPPLPQGAASLTTLSAIADISNAELEVTAGVGNVPANNALIIRATPQVSPGKKFLKGMHRNIALITSGQSLIVNVWSNYISRFGTPSAGQKIGIECYYINTVTGEKSPAFSTDVIVQA